MENFSNILVMDLAFIGDVVLAGPAIRALKGRFPSARLTMMTMPQTASVASMLPGVDDVIIYDKHGSDKGLIGMWRMAKKIRERGFDLSISINFATRGAFVAFLAKIPDRLGYDAQRAGLFLNHVASSKREMIMHESMNHFEVLRPLSIACEDSSLSLIVPESAKKSLDQKRAVHFIPESGYLVVAPVGSYDRKDLPLMTAAHIVRHYAKRRPIFLIGGKNEEDRLLTIANAARLPAKNVLAGALTLPELAAFLERAECLITVDTGPLHIAQAVSCRTVAVFGPTDPAVWGPRGDMDAILQHPADCSPCWGRGKCEKKMICIEGVTAREIIRAVDSNKT